MSTRGGRAGYTLVEVMMSLTILAIGATGIFALQGVAVRGNADAADLTAATNIGRDWLERIKTQALEWNTSALPGDIADAPQLHAVYTALGAWVALDATPQRRDGIPDPAGQFCAHARAAPPTVVGALPGVTSLELTVRVWWFKGTDQDRALYLNCGAGQAAVMSGEINKFHFVYLTTLVTPHPQI